MRADGDRCAYCACECILRVCIDVHAYTTSVLAFILFVQEKQKKFAEFAEKKKQKMELEEENLMQIFMTDKARSLVQSMMKEIEKSKSGEHPERMPSSPSKKSINT